MKIQVERPRFGVNYGPGWSGFTIRKKDFVAAGIRWFERWDKLPDLPSPSHAFKIAGRDATIEAFGDGVKWGSLTAYLKDPEVALLVRKPRGYTLEMGDFLVHEGMKHLGEKYGYGLIVAHALANTYAGHLLTRLTKGWFERAVTHALDARRQQVCSELEARTLQAWPALAGRGILRQPPETIKPVQLFRDPEVYEPGDEATELVEEIPAVETEGTSAAQPARA